VAWFAVNESENIQLASAKKQVMGVPSHVSLVLFYRHLRVSSASLLGNYLQCTNFKIIATHSHSRFRDKDTTSIRIMGVKCRPQKHQAGLGGWPPF